MGSMGTYPWEMPPEMCRSIPGGTPKRVQPQCWDKPSARRGDPGTVPCPLRALAAGGVGGGGRPLLQSCGTGHEGANSPRGLGVPWWPLPEPILEGGAGAISPFPPHRPSTPGAFLGPGAAKSPTGVRGQPGASGRCRGPPTSPARQAGCAPGRH